MILRSVSFAAFAPLACLTVALVACADGDTAAATEGGDGAGGGVGGASGATTTGVAASSGSASTSSASGGGAASSASSAGGAASSSSSAASSTSSGGGAASSSSAASGSGGSTATSSSTGGSSELNGCTSYDDRTAANADRTVVWDFSIASDPERCLRVQVGQVLKYQGDFVAHPMMPKGGDGQNPYDTYTIFNDGVPGEEYAEVTFQKAGTFGFACFYHPSMTGATEVVP